MVSTVIDILNARLELTGFFHSLYCLVEKKREKRGEGDHVYPAQYVGGGDLQMIEFDSAGFAYFRKDGEITQSIVENDFGQSQWYEVTIPLRLVAMVNRSAINGDDAFSPDALARQLASSLTFKNGDLRTALTAAKTQVNAANWTTDPEQIWSDETEGTGAIEPDYSRAFIAMSVTVSVTADERCIQNLCEADTDILHIFDFCKAATVARLTDEQVACLEAALCETPPTLCEQLAEVEPADVVADVFDCLTEAAQTELLDSECFDGTVNITNTDSDPIATVTVASGGVEPYVIPNVAWTNSNGDAESTPYGDAILCDMAAGGSVSVAVSDATPSAGDTITITATTTGFTPTNHLFFTYDGATIEEIVEQASGVYNWSVDRVGTYDIYVLATDGTTSAYGTVGIVATSIFVLDLITPQPIWACDFRRLRAGYVGPACMVRRSSDNATLAIGFIGEDLDTASLIGHVGVGGGFTATLYNQMGTGTDAFQTTAGSQPAIVVGGTVQTINGRPTIVFNGSSSEMVLPVDVTFSHGFLVGRKSAIVNPIQYIFGGTGQGLGFGGTLGGFTNIFAFTPGGSLVSSVNNTLPHQVSLRLGGSGRLRVDGVTESTGTTSASMTINRIGNRPDTTTLRHAGDFSGCYLYSSVLTDAEELIIENNQRNYYGL